MKMIEHQYILFPESKKYSSMTYKERLEYDMVLLRELVREYQKNR